MPPTPCAPAGKVARAPVTHQIETGVSLRQSQLQTYLMNDLKQIQNRAVRIIPCLYARRILPFHFLKHDAGYQRFLFAP